jgi:hypothetical protein
MSVVNMSTNNHLTAPIVRRAKEELREYALLSAYLYVCFGALILYKMAILGAVDISYLPLGLPAIKALVLAKFILLGHAVRLGDRYEKRRLVYVIACKALLYLVLVIVLSAVEEGVVGIIDGRTIAASLAEIGGGKLPQILATSLIMLLVLIPYLAFGELNAVLGEGRLWKMLFEHRAGLQSASRRKQAKLDDTASG